MNTTCTECGRTFSFRDALPDKRRSHNKLFGCPHCKTFFEKRMMPNPRKYLTVALLGGGVTTPALFMIFNYLANGQILFLFYGALILLSSIATLAVNARDVSLPIKRVDL